MRVVVAPDKFGGTLTAAEAVPELAAVHLDPVMLSDTGAWLTDVRVRLAPPARRPGPEVRRLVGEDEA